MARHYYVARLETSGIVIIMSVRWTTRENEGITRSLSNAYNKTSSTGNYSQRAAVKDSSYC